MARQRPSPLRAALRPDPLARFACPNPECPRFNHFAAGNLHVAEGMGPRREVRRLYCDLCGQRFSEHHGTLLQDSKLPLVAVVRILKCLMHGCSIEAAADICDVTPRTVERLLEVAGRRAGDFHRLYLGRLNRPPPAVQLDELHARVATAAGKKGGAGRHGGQRRDHTGARAGTGSILLWR